ncbi:MAG TPA: indolepyruvate ferredoxin oxidoreductase subunit beta [Candidatus Methanomethylophilaceae archaeon]|nr:indolepyruvate ferredoxin oxidoreductase subunit beta [Candidatus Methanomethylophilaceae archaeon]
MKYTVQIVGVGGQGVLLASMVIGNAAMKEGYDLAMSEVHGMAQRGGSVLSTVRFGDGVISPLEAAGGANLLMGFEPAETARNISLCNKDTSVLMNLNPIYPSSVAAGFDIYPEVEDIVKAVSDVVPKLITIDATDLAVKAGKAVTANAVMIGAIAAAEGFPISKEALLETLLDTVPAKFTDINKRAFELGFEYYSSRGTKQ